MKQASSSQRRRFTKEERSKWLIRFRSSGLTQREFAARNGLKWGTLVQWLARERRASTPPSSFVEVALPPVGSSEDWVAELNWPSGLRLRLGASAPRNWLGMILKGVR